MSEEQDKFEKRRKEAEKRKKKLQKMQNSKVKPGTKRALGIAGGSILAILLVAVIVVANAGFTRRMVTALEVGDQKVSSAEFSYYYVQQALSTYNMYYQYTGGSYIPFDTGKSLNKQKYSDTQTWEDYFVESAVTAVQNIKTLVLAAQAEGFTLSESGKAAVESTMTSLATQATQQKVSLDRYLTAIYGVGMNENLMRSIQLDYQLAMEYEDDLKARPEYTTDELEDYYQNTVKDTYTYVDIRYMSFNKVEATDSTEGKTVEQAKAEAEEFIDGITSEEKYSERVIEVKTENAKKSDDYDPTKEITDNSKRTAVSASTLKSLDANLGEWAFADGRAAGDVAVVENSSGTGYFAVYMVTPAYRYDYHTMDVRQIYVKVEDTSDEEEMATAKKRAEDLLAQWKSGAATEDSFAELANQESDLKSDGGLAQRVTKTDDAVGQWIFDSSRKPGDTAVVESTAGYHVLYMVGEDQAYWEIQVEAAKRNADYNETYQALQDQYGTVVRHDFGIALKSKPF